MPDGRLILLVDTVGFIHKLPAHLVKAFRSTLEEVNEADLLVHVVDASSPMAELQMKVTHDELSNLGAAFKPIITVLNKQDLVQEEEGLVIPYKAEAVVKISALEEEGQNALMAAIGAYLDKLDSKMELLIPYDKAGIADRLHREAVILQEDYTDEGIAMTIRADEELKRIVKPYEKQAA